MPYKLNLLLLSESRLGHVSFYTLKKKTCFSRLLHESLTNNSTIKFGDYMISFATRGHCQKPEQLL